MIVLRSKHSLVRTTTSPLHRFLLTNFVNTMKNPIEKGPSLTTTTTTKGSLYSKVNKLSIWEREREREREEVRDGFFKGAQMRIIQSTRLGSAHDIKILIFCNLLNADFSNIFVAEETELHRFHALRRYLQITHALKSFVNYNFKLIIR